MLYFYCYTSELADPSADVEAVLADIRCVAKARNAECGITGVLFFDKGRFLQILEGEQNKLGQLMSSIQRDPRHRNITLLFQEPIKRRSFGQWNMDTLDLSDEEALAEDVLIRIRDAFTASFNTSAGAFIKVAKSLLKNPHFVSLVNR